MFILERLHCSDEVGCITVMGEVREEGRGEGEDAFQTLECMGQ